MAGFFEEYVADANRAREALPDDAAGLHRLFELAQLPGADGAS